MVYAQPSSCPGEWHTQTPLGLWLTNGSPNIGQTTRPFSNQQKKKKRTCKVVDLAVLADHRIKLKEREQKDKYRDLVMAWTKSMEHEGDDYTYRDWCFRYSN